MAVIQTYRDGRYAWRCEDCGRPRLGMAHCGPRKSVCKACQNKRYRRLGGDALRARNRYRMRLRRARPGRPSWEGTVVGPEQRCFPFRTRPGLWNGRTGSLPTGITPPTGVVQPVRSRHETPCRVRPLRPVEQTEWTAAPRLPVSAGQREGWRSERKRVTGLERSA